MHSGAAAVIETASRKVIWKDTKGKPLIGCCDSGYKDGVQVLGYFQTTGEILWLTWTKLDEKFSARENWRGFAPVIGLSEICKASTEVFTSVYVTDRCQVDRNWDTIHAVLATNHCSIVFAWNLLRVHRKDHAVHTERTLGKQKQSVVVLPSREQLSFVTCDKSAYSFDDGGGKVYVLCGTVSRTFILAFTSGHTHGSILFSFCDVFDSAVLEQYVFYGVSDGAVTMYEYLEEPFRLFTYGTVDERQGRINKMRCSDGGCKFQKENKPIT